MEKLTVKSLEEIDLSTRIIKPYPFNPDNYWTRNRDSLLDKMKQYGFTCLGSGLDRIAYLSPNLHFVLKFSTSSYSVEANKNEANIWKRRRKFRSKRFAPCRLITDGVLLMHAMVELYGTTPSCQVARNFLKSELHDATNCPDWEIDSRQFGRLRNGKFAIYDYGSE